MRSFIGVSEVIKANMGRKRFFGVVYMWFLVYVRSQGVIKDSMKVGSVFLYQGDRGWLEVFGGSGAFLIRKRLVGVLQRVSFNSVLVYLSGIIFCRGVVLIMVLVL